MTDKLPSELRSIILRSRVTTFNVLQETSITFIQFYDGWNAVLMDALQFPDYDKDDVGEIIFSDCARLRLGTLNDEG